MHHDLKLADRDWMMACSYVSSYGEVGAVMCLAAYLGETRGLLLGSTATHRCASSSGSSSVSDVRTCPRSKLQACLPNVSMRGDVELLCCVFNGCCDLLVNALSPKPMLLLLCNTGRQVQDAVFCWIRGEG